MPTRPSLLRVHSAPAAEYSFLLFFFNCSFSAWDDVMTRGMTGACDVGIWCVLFTIMRGGRGGLRRGSHGRDAWPEPDEEQKVREPCHRTLSPNPVRELCPRALPAYPRGGTLSAW
eukprot:TRINITY_DN35765_c0_g1_i1.p1 TRINITY_DN35765_c0_g1~~TRINITY_DN35765_c0_g1_i1.p1  ORF type:complete len:116 (+),score=4.21 TRINITY_DN35765_c0_g1_i1:396-743(+)